MAISGTNDSKPATAEPRARRERLLRRIVVGGLAVFCLAALLGAELAARYYERHRTTPPDYFPSIYYPHQRLRYGLIPSLDYYGWFRINSLGFRGREVSARKAPGVLRVICLGGSTTFEVGSVGDARPWPETLEEDLRRRLGAQPVEVLNLGISGATSLDSLIDLQTRALTLDPDLLVVYQGHNDFNYSIPRGRQTRSALFPMEDSPRSGLARWFTYNSLLYAKAQGQMTERIRSIENWLGSLAPGPATTVSPADRDASIETGFQEYRANLHSIAAIAKANGIPLVLPGIVLPFMDEAEGSCTVCTQLSSMFGDLEPASVRRTFDRYDRVLEELAGEDVLYVRTKGFVPSADQYYSDPIHFGREGSLRMGQKLGEAIAPFLVRARSSALSGVQDGRDK